MWSELTTRFCMVSSQKISGCSSKIICRELWNAAYTCFSVYPLMLTVILSLFALSPLRKVLCMLSASLSFASWVLHRSYPLEELEELLDFLLLELLCSVLVDGVRLPGLPRAAEVLTAMLSTIAIARAVERFLLLIIFCPLNRFKELQIALIIQHPMSIVKKKIVKFFISV